MKNTTGLYKHQRDNQGKRRRLTGDVVSAAMLLPVVKYEYQKSRETMKEPYVARLQQDLIAAIDSLRDLLPLAEDYLKAAPGHPDNAKLETARAILKEYGPSTGESPQASRKRGEGSPRFTKRERRALLEAAVMRLAGEMEDVDIPALERAQEKLSDG